MATTGVWLPMLSELTVQVATAEPFSATLLQSDAPLSVKLMLPPGVPPPCGVTVAVKVTACPAADGLTLEVSAVVVLALLTVRVKFCVALLPMPLAAVKVSA